MEKVNTFLESRSILQLPEGNMLKRPRWPMIVLRSAKGWTSPREVDGHYLEGFWRAHQLPIPDIATNPAHLKPLETWMRGY